MLGTFVCMSRCLPKIKKGVENKLINTVINMFEEITSIFYS